mgnify:CR=1 FL=1
MALTKVTADVLDVSLGADWQADIKTADFNATNGEGYFVNTTSGSVTVTLPAGTQGDEITFQDYSGTFDASSINFTPNGSQKIQGVESDYSCSTKDTTVRLIYQDDTQGWNGNNLLPAQENIHFLVVAGGGGGSSGYGGSPQAGGGAGGLRTSWGSLSGGGNSAENPIALATGTNYTVTIGAGGGGAANNSGYMAGTGGTSQFGTITTAGGGAARNWSTSAASGSGGSGAGQAYSTNGGPGSGTANQGFGGGAVTVAGPGAGGGGAGSAGSWSSGSLGIGGNGINIDITGSTVSYAGGGGRTLGTPPGGGGQSAASPGAGGNGTANTGGGGGGGNGTGASYIGGQGGTGVVILRYPSSRSITIPGGLTSTTSVVGSDKVTIFTAGTGNIQFT